MKISGVNILKPNKQYVQSFTWQIANLFIIVMVMVISAVISSQNHVRI